MIPQETFKIIVENTPLVSIDFVIINEKNAKILLGKRVNRPACGYYFTLGGRVFKDESIEKAKHRIFEAEFGSDLGMQTKFLGIFEHFYEDSIFHDVSTHYINLGYEVNVNDEIEGLPFDQHSTYKWFDRSELLESSEVHSYVKNYINGKG